MLTQGNGAAASKALPRLLDCRPQANALDWRGLARPEMVAAIGADDAEDRARMLAHGMGEALPSATAVAELSARLMRIQAAASALPRNRPAGPVMLDLFVRDGKIGDRWLGLFPREFGLLWRLAERPGRRVTRGELLRDVWRLAHDPGTNSLEVHISRLRAKLAISRASWLVETHPEGGYRLNVPRAADAFRFRYTSKDALDMGRALGNGGGQPIPSVSQPYASQ